MRGLLAVEAAGTAASTTAAAALNGAVDWWRDVNESPLWQDRTFHTLAVLYGIVSVIALVSPARLTSATPGPWLDLSEFCDQIEFCADFGWYVAQLRALVSSAYARV